MNSKNMFLALVLCLASGSVFGAASDDPRIFLGLNHQRMGDFLMQSGDPGAAFAEYECAVKYLQGTRYETSVREDLMSAISQDVSRSSDVRVKLIMDQERAIKEISESRSDQEAPWAGCQDQFFCQPFVAAPINNGKKPRVVRMRVVSKKKS